MLEKLVTLAVDVAIVLLFGLVVWLVIDNLPFQP